nr:PREDICTED: uncharacterized protein LOC109029736 isoform X1 [Bemisia tabaci]
MNNNKKRTKEKKEKQRSHSRRMSDEQLLLMTLPENDDEDEEHRRRINPARKKTVIKGRSPRYVNQGAANVMKQWPSHHSHMHFLLTLAAILFLIFFFLLYISCFRKNPLGPIDAEKRKCIAEDFNRIKRLYKKVFGAHKKTLDEDCKDFYDRERALVELENSTSESQIYSLINDCNIFYVHSESMPFSHLKACAMESALRYAPDKQFFFIRLTKCSPKAEHMEDGETDMNSLVHNLTAVLRNDYPNLKIVTTDGCKYFSGSPLKDLWQDNSELINKAAQILTVWRFGGTVLSLNALVTNRKLFEQIESSVEVCKFLIRSRLQCNNFVRELLLQMREKLVPAGNSKNKTVSPNNSTSTELISDVIDKSLENFCHNPVGCTGVRRIERSKICKQVEEQCYLLDFKGWRQENLDWQKSIQYFCPSITRRSMNFTI